MAKLIVTDENGKTREQELGDVTSIGRSSANTIQITDGKSSRQHFRVERDGDYYKVVDLGSTNGTRLNGRKVTVQRLRKGDKMSVGQTTFVYEGPEEPASKVVASPAASEDLASTVPEGASPVAAAEGGPKYVLVIVEGKDAGKSYPMGREPVTLGRKSANTIPVDDDSASSFHAEVKKEPIGFVLSDLGSTNGTRVKPKGGAEFEKVIKAPLSVGAQIRIGKTVIEFRNEGAPVEGDEVFSTVALDPDKVSAGPAAALPMSAPAARKGVPTPVLVLLCLALFGGIVFAVVKLVGPSAVPLTPPTGGPDKPVVIEQLVKNPGFDDGTTADGKPVGWEPSILKLVTVEPDGDADPAAPADKKHGLVVRKDPQGAPHATVSVESKDSFPIDPGKVYDFSGWARNDGDGLYGLSITWRKGDRTLTYHPVVNRGTQEGKVLKRAVRAPLWAERATVGIFVEGHEGKAYFDNLSFKLDPKGEAPESPTIANGGVSVTLDTPNGAFTVSSLGATVADSGLLEIVTPDTKAWGTIVSALDPNLTREGNKTTVHGDVFDYALQTFAPYLLEVQPGAGGVEMSFAKDPNPGASTPRVSMTLSGPVAEGDYEVRKGAAEPQKVSSLENQGGGDVTEVLFNVGSKPQLYLRFSSGVAFETKRLGAKRQISFSFASKVSVEFAAEHAGKRKELEKLLASCNDALRADKKDWPKLYKCFTDATELGKNFNEARNMADTLKSALDAGFAKDKAESDRKLQQAKDTGKDSPEVFDTVGAFITGLKTSWAGTSHENEFADALNKLSQIKNTTTSGSKEDTAKKLLERASDMFKDGKCDYNVAVLAKSFANKVVKEFGDTASAGPAKDLMGKIDAFIKEQDGLQAIDREIVERAQPRVEAGQTDEAIDIIEKDKRFQQYGDKLPSTTKLLKSLKKK